MSWYHIHSPSSQAQLFAVIVILVASWTFIIFSGSVNFGGPGLFPFSLWRKSADHHESFRIKAPHTTTENMTSCDHVDSENSQPCNSIRERIDGYLLDIERRYGYDVIVRSQVSRGDPARTTLLLAKLLSGRHVSIAAIGGSVTAALYLPTPLEVGEGSYPWHVTTWLNKAFPTIPGQPPHSFIRAFLPGAGSFAMRFCAFELFRQLWGGKKAAEEGKKADFVILECAANDFVMVQPGMAPLPVSETFIHAETLVRNILRLPSAPPIAFLHLGVHDFNQPQNSLYTNSGAFLLDAMSSFYRVMEVSMWRAFFPLLSEKGGANEGGFNFTHWFVDKSHPSVAGLEAAGDFLAHNLFSEFRDILDRQAQVALEKGATKVEQGGKIRKAKSWRSIELIQETTSGNMSLACAGMVLETFFPNVAKIGNISDAKDGKHKKLHDLVLELVNQASQLANGNIPSAKPLVDKELRIDAGPHLGLGFRMPKPIQSKDKTDPMCLMARDWNISRIGGTFYDKGLVPKNGTHIVNGSAWELRECGPLLPRIRCWFTKQSKQPISVYLDLRGKKYDTLGFLYKIRDSYNKENKDSGADVRVTGSELLFLKVGVKGNTLTHWYLETRNFPKGKGRRSIEVEIQPRTYSFNIIAIVAD